MSVSWSKSQQLSILRLIDKAREKLVHPRTVHLAVHLLHACRHIEGLHTASACLYIASKYEDIDQVDASRLGDPARIVEHERVVLLAVDFNLVRRTVYDVLGCDDPPTILAGMATLLYARSLTNPDRYATRVPKLLAIGEAMDGDAQIVHIVSRMRKRDLIRRLNYVPQIDSGMCRD